MLQITLVLPHPRTLLSARAVLPLGLNADNLLCKSCLRVLEQGTYYARPGAYRSHIRMRRARGSWPTSPAAASLRVRSSVKSRLPTPEPEPEPWPWTGESRRRQRDRGSKRLQLVRIREPDADRPPALLVPHPISIRIRSLSVPGPVTVTRQLCTQSTAVAVAPRRDRCVVTALEHHQVASRSMIL